MSESKSKEVYKEAPAEQVYVGSGVRPVLKNRKSIVTVSVLVVIGIGLFLLLSRSPLFKKAFIIEGKSYTVSDVKKLTADSHAYTSLSDEDVAKLAFTYYKEQQASKDLGFVPTQAQIDEAKKALPGASKQSKDNAWMDLLAFHNALPTYLVSLTSGIHRGYSFVFDFSGRLIPQDPEVPTPGWGDQQLIAKDQAYAKKQAEDYRSQIASGKLSAQALLDKIQHDPLLGLKDNTVNFSTLHSAQFDDTAGPYWQAQVANQSIVDYISSQSKPGLSNVQLADVTITNSAIVPAKHARGEYYFVQIDSMHKAVPDAQKQLEAKVKTMEAHYYGL